MALETIDANETDANDEWEKQAELMKLIITVESLRGSARAVITQEKLDEITQNWGMPDDVRIPFIKDVCKSAESDITFH